MNERILNSFQKPRVAKRLRSNCEALSTSTEDVPPVSPAQEKQATISFVDSEAEEA
jgi:hypothetical protein